MKVPIPESFISRREYIKRCSMGVQRYEYKRVLHFMRQGHVICVVGSYTTCFEAKFNRELSSFGEENSYR